MPKALIWKLSFWVKRIGDRRYLIAYVILAVREYIIPR